MEVKTVYKKYICHLFLFLFGTLFFVGIFNYFVNPYNIFQVPSCKYTYLKPEAKLQERVTKFIGFKFDKREINSVFLGTSRADYSIDRDYFKEITGKDAENMAMGGMVLEEYPEIIDMILQIHPEVKNLYLGTDFIMFGGKTVFDEKSKAKITEYPFLTPTDVCTALFSITGLRDSFWTIIKNILGLKTRMYYPNGLRYVTRNDRIEDSFGEAIVEYTKKYETFEYNPDKMKIIREIKEYCSQRGVKLHLFVMPTHVLDMQLMEMEGVYDDFLQWKADLSEVMPFYDFQYPCPVTNEEISPDMKYFFEISHATPLTGRLVLEEMVLDNKDFGRLYTREYAYILNETDRDELMILADENDKRTKFLYRVWRKIKSAV